jgi:hypothetical protein
MQEWEGVSWENYKLQNTNYKQNSWLEYANLEECLSPVSIAGISSEKCQFSLPIVKSSIYPSWPGT